MQHASRFTRVPGRQTQLSWPGGEAAGRNCGPHVCRVSCVVCVLPAAWFLEACETKAGVASMCLFMTTDLFEGTNMKQVCLCLNALKNST